MLLGHAPAQTQLAQLLATGRMPHALLLSGPQGIGKSLLAQKLAYRLICGADPHSNDPLAANHTPQFFQMEAGSCPDYHLITIPDGKKSIGVEPVRQLLTTLKRTADTNRVVILDSLDDVTPEAANTLLKTLEEPRPGIYFILIAHRLAQTLPTIRSRCRLMLLSPLSDAETAKVLTGQGIETEELPALLARAKGCPGQVLGTTPPLEVALQTLAATPTYAHAQTYHQILTLKENTDLLNLPKADALDYATTLLAASN